MASASLPLTKAIYRTIELPRTGRVSVALTPLGVMYREFRRRRWYLLPHGAAFIAAVELEVAAAMEKRGADRDGRSKRRRRG